MLCTDKDFLKEFSDSILATQRLQDTKLIYKK